jgi:hypothetical protein
MVVAIQVTVQPRGLSDEKPLSRSFTFRHGHRFRSPHVQPMRLYNPCRVLTAYTGSPKALLLDSTLYLFSMNDLTLLAAGISYRALARPIWYLDQLYKSSQVLGQYSHLQQIGSQASFVCSRASS